MKTAQLLKSDEIVKQHLEAAREVLRRSPNGVPPSLATIQVGEAEDAVLYSNYLSRFLKKHGFRWIPNVFSGNEAERVIVERIEKLNHDKEVTGIMVFSPLPKHLDMTNILNNIEISKDVEGRTFLKNHFGVASPTAHAVLALIKSVLPDLAGKQAAVVGHSDLVGKPAAILLMDEMATVTVCHAKTENIKKHLGSADIVVVAVGKPNIIPGEWIREGAVVIDVGENMLNGKLVGDVEFESAKKRASYISPVPGGVGPVTSVMLINNLIKLSKIQESINGAR